MRTALVILLLFAAVAKGQIPIYKLDTNRQVHYLAGTTAILVDSVEKFITNEVLSGEKDHLFVRYNSVANQKNKNYTYWLRFAVQPIGSVNNWVMLVEEIDHNDLYNDRLESFVLGPDRKLISSDQAGPLIKRSAKKLRHSAGFNGLSFSANQQVVVYIKVSNPFRSTTGYSQPVIQHPAIPNSINPVAPLLSILNVIATLFCIMSFFFYIFVKEKAYLFFAFYTLVLSQHYLILHPDVPFVDFYIPEHPGLLPGFWSLLTVGGFFLFCLFGRSFMNLRSLAPKTDKWFVIYLICWSVIILINTTLLLLGYSAKFTGILQTVFGTILIGFFIRFALFKSILTRLFIAGAFWLILFTVLGLLVDNGMIKLYFNPWPIGQVGQLLIYAAALAYKVRMNERARAEANRIRDMDEIKSRFFANISHEFRTPLTLIQGPLQQIEESSSGAKEAVNVPLRHIKTMRRNTDRLLELVNQLLDLSKLDSGKMKLQMVKGDLTQLLKAITASYESVAERKGIHYQVHFPESNSIHFFDKDKLEKIISNLLTNAFKYTPESGTVSVTAELENGRLRFSVDDTGTGIPKKELDKIFDRFYQLEGTEDKGSGIGLALVKELVSLYRGQISVNSEPGKGSRFRVTLPVDKSMFREEEFVYGQWQAEETFINRSIEESLKGNPNLDEQETLQQLPLLLVVEDNRDLREFIVDTVRHKYNVIQATNGSEGFEKALAEIPDVILSDVMMPVMDGFTMTNQLKGDQRTSHIPVILLTAKAGQAHKIEGLSTGADDYLIKPFDAPELLVRLQNLVNQRKLLRRKFAGEILLKPSEVAVKSGEEVFLQKLMATIEKNMSEEDFGVEELAKEMAMSRSQLHRKLIALTGQSPSEALRNTRLLRAKELLIKKSATPSEVAFQVGFNSHAYFSKCFKEEFGISPSEVGIGE